MNKLVNSSKIQLKRVYLPPSKQDGVRILVDRLWPRGLRKEDAALDHWCKDIAPSSELRKWFGHDPERWEEFRKRYKAEIDSAPEAFADLKTLIPEGPVTLLFAAHDEDHNNAVVLHELLCSENYSHTKPKGVKAASGS